MTVPLITKILRSDPKVYGSAIFESKMSPANGLKIYEVNIYR